MLSKKEILNKFKEVLGEASILTAEADLKEYGKDWCQEFPANPSVILTPKNINEVQDILRICSEFNIAIVPSGGRTGLSGGATATKNEIILSLSKFKTIIEINKADRTVRCEAGVTLQELQEAVQKKGFFFPVDLPSKGSSQIGGNIATNAGGIRVVRWGNIRDWVLGLKVVTADGTILDMNDSLVKNNTGYDFKSLLIGSEGTLGIIIEAVLKLTNIPNETVRVFAGVNSYDKVIECFVKTREKFPGLCAFEYMDQNSLNKVIQHKKLRFPLSEISSGYLLIEIEKTTQTDQEKIENFLGELLENEILSDATLSQNQKQADELLSLRESISETLSSHYTIHKNDISVPTHLIPQFLSFFEGTLQHYRGCIPVIFGHIGDGNLHINFLKPEGMDKESFYKISKENDLKLFEVVQKFKGSVSAEHGVGLLKKSYLHFTRSNYEVDLMKQVKKVFDPKGILNPGKIFD